MNKKTDLQEKILNLFIPKNISLKVALKIIEEKTESANNVEELSNILEFIRSLNLSFKNEKFGLFYLGVISFIFLVGTILFGVSITRVSFEVLKYLFWLNFAFTVVAIINGMFIFRKIKHTEKISDSIAFKKVALENNFSFDASNKSKKKLLQIFEIEFFIFRQGNHSSELAKHIKGKYKDKFEYNYFNLHYVDEHTSTSTDGNGNQNSNTTYTHYDLYGIIIPFNLKQFIKISNYETALKFKKFTKWKTSSIAFNKKFKIYTNNEQAMALFLQPKVIEEIEKLYETFPELDIELSPHGLLALSTTDKELLNCNRKYGVDQLDLFQKELEEVLDQTKLHTALEFIDFLKEYHK